MLLRYHRLADDPTRRGGEDAIRMTYTDNRQGMTVFVKTAQKEPVIVLTPDAGADLDEFKKGIAKSGADGLKISYGDATDAEKKLQEYRRSHANAVRLLRYAEELAADVRSKTQTTAGLAQETQKTIDFVRWRFNVMNGVGDGMSMFGGTVSRYDPLTHTYEDTDKVTEEDKLADEGIYWRNKCKATEFYMEREDEFDRCIERIGATDARITEADIEDWAKEKKEEVAKWRAEKFAPEPEGWFLPGEENDHDTRVAEGMGKIDDCMAAVDGAALVVLKCEKRLDTVKKFVEKRYFFKNAKIVEPAKKDPVFLRDEDEIKNLVDKLDYGADIDKELIKDGAKTYLVTPVEYKIQLFDILKNELANAISDSNPLGWVRAIFKMSSEGDSLEEIQRKLRETFIPAATEKIKKIRIAQASSFLFDPSKDCKLIDSLYARYSGLLDNIVEYEKLAVENIARFLILKRTYHGHKSAPELKDIEKIEESFAAILSVKPPNIPKYTPWMGEFSSQVIYGTFNRAKTLSVEMISSIKDVNPEVFVKETLERIEKFEQFPGVYKEYISKTTNMIMAMIDTVAKYKIPSAYLSTVNSKINDVERNRVDILDGKDSYILSIVFFTAPPIVDFFKKLQQDFNTPNGDMLPNRPELSDNDKLAFNRGNPIIPPEDLEVVEDVISRLRQLKVADLAFITDEDQEKIQKAEITITDAVRRFKSPKTIPDSYIFTVPVQGGTMFMTGFTMRMKVFAYLKQLADDLKLLRENIPGKPNISRHVKVNVMALNGVQGIYQTDFQEDDITTPDDDPAPPDLDTEDIFATQPEPVKEDADPAVFEDIEVEDTREILEPPLVATGAENEIIKPTDYTAEYTEDAATKEQPVYSTNKNTGPDQISEIAADKDAVAESSDLERVGEPLLKEATVYEKETESSPRPSTAVIDPAQEPTKPVSKKPKSTKTSLLRLLSSVPPPDPVPAEEAPAPEKRKEEKTQKEDIVQPKKQIEKPIEEQDFDDIFY